MGRFSKGLMLGMSWSLFACAPAQAQAQEECLMCHAQADLKSPKGKSLFVDEALYKASAHGQREIGCVDCHAGADGEAKGDAPHPMPLPAGACSGCHEDAAAAHGKSKHQEAGVECTSCHNPHVPGPGLDLAARNARCTECHSTDDTHEWLPEKAKHASIECAACHASAGDRQVVLEPRLKSADGVRPLKAEAIASAPALPQTPLGGLSAQQLEAWAQGLKQAGLGDVVLGVKVLVAAPAHDFTVKPQEVKTCQGCHAERPGFLQSYRLQLPAAGDKGFTLEPVERGAVPMLSIATFADSVHGRAGVPCIACHQEMNDLTAARASGVKEIGTIVCAKCHATQIAQYQASVHARASDKVCFGCHNPHANVPFRSLRGEERQAICLECHAAVKHDWLPQENAHRHSLECTTCHAPLARKGISFSFETEKSGAKLGAELLQGLVPATREAMVAQVDTNSDGIVQTGEILGYLAELGKRLSEPVRLRPEVLILESNHDFSKGARTSRECTQCHSSQAEFYDKLFVQLPAPGGGVISLPVEREILGQMNSARGLGDLYLLGESRMSRKDVDEVLEALGRVGYRWVDVLGVLVLLGGLGFVGLHGLLRLLTIPRRRRRRP